MNQIKTQKLISPQRSNYNLNVEMRRSKSKESLTRNDANQIVISDQDREEIEFSRNYEGNLGVPQHQNRLSLGGMVFGLQVKQFSDAPLKNVREKSEQARPIKDQTIDEDLDELQSIFSRHHSKFSASPSKTSQKKKRPPVDLYRIEQNSINDNTSIFNGSDSHLNEDFTISI